MADHEEPTPAGDDVNDDVDAARQENTRLRAEVKALRDEAEKMRKEATRSHGAAFGRLETELAELRRRNSELGAEVDALRRADEGNVGGGGALRGVEHELSDLRRHNGELEAELDALRRAAAGRLPLSELEEIHRRAAASRGLTHTSPSPPRAAAGGPAHAQPAAALTKNESVSTTDPGHNNNSNNKNDSVDEASGAEGTHKTSITLSGMGTQPVAVLYQHPRAFGQPSRDPDCVVAHALLRLHGVPYTTHDCTSGWVSPTGRLPILRRLPGVTDSIVIGCHGIERYGASHATSTRTTTATAATATGADTPTPAVSATRAAFVDLVVGRCRPAVLYELWCEPESYASVAKPLFRNLYPWPLDSVLALQTQWQTRQTTLGSGRVSSSTQLYGDAASVFDSLALQLGDQQFLFGNRPLPVDAYAYGYLSHILEANLPSGVLRPRVTKHRNLVEYCDRFKNHIFGNS
eukprot:m.208886 g.208886  ORF g.208886 m.208886 type:complete len:464 (+) comp24294_c0_seq1:111-1502(+)